MKKTFNLEFDTLEVPTESDICESIEKYAKSSGAKIDFVSRKVPITFRLNGKTFVTRRGTSRGGPTVYCTECKESNEI